MKLLSILWIFHRSNRTI